MRQQHRAIALLIAAFLCLATTSGRAAQESPRQLVQQTTKQVLAKLHNERAELKADPDKLYDLIQSDILPHFDFARMSRWVLGIHWRQATPAQRNRFETQFRNLLVDTYGNALLKYSGQSIEYLPTESEPASGKVLVRTRLHQSGENTLPVDYRLHNDHGQWKVFDVSIDGISLLTNYRQTFSEQVQQVGLDGLIKSMAKRHTDSSG